jgi:hypothetical protein
MMLPLLLQTGPEETALRFRSLPPMWLLFMVMLPAIILFVWWIYRREGQTATSTGRRVLAVMRIMAITLILLLVFQPYAETSVKKLVKSHLVVLLDTSASMEFSDTYSDSGKAGKTSEAAGLGGASPSTVSRIDLAKGALTNRGKKIIERLAGKFHLHFYTFDAETVLRFSASELEEGSDTTDLLSERIRAIRATGAWTFLGGSVSQVIEEFRLRDEPLAGVVILTDGRQNGGTVGPLVAARKAAEAQPRVPLYVVGIGDPDLPRNLHVANLRAKEVVLRGDDVTFEFTLTNKGFAGELVTATLESIDEEGNRIDELDLKNADVVVDEEGVEQAVRVSHRFEVRGFYTVRIGIPVQPGEKIENDNFIVHHIQVVDKKIKVLYVEGYPRWEYRFLKDALTRDTETILAHVVNLDADSSVVQPYSDSPGWKPRQRFPRTREELFEYHVVIFGDVDWTRLGEGNEELSKEMLANVKSFVDEGGGFIMIAGPYDSPRSYRSTDLRDILPVELSREEEWGAYIDPTRSFNLRLTDEGRRHPIMQLETDPKVSAALWEEEKFSAQFWYYPVTRAKVPPAIVLAEHSGEHNRNTFGPHVLMAVMPYGKGLSLFLGVDELWRLRWATGSRYHYRFYGEAIRMLATYKLLGGNIRFKIFTDRNRYFVGDTVEITADVYDRDFEAASEDTQTVTIRFPDGEEEERKLVLDPESPGRYRLAVTVHQEGTYRISADPGDGEGEIAKKLFKVEYSTEEMKNPLIDLDTLSGMARESGGRFFPLYELASIPDVVASKSVYVSSEVRSEDLWDDLWVLFLFTGLLGAEWLLRKRYRLL